MKTELMLLIQTDGNPLVSLKHMATLLNIGERSVLNKIYSHTMPFPVFQVAGSTAWSAHVQDVAKYIDELREKAQREYAEH